MISEELENPLLRRSRRRMLISAAIIIPVALSLSVHGAAVLYMRFARLAQQRPGQLTDAPAPETVLVLDGPPAPPPERRLLPPPPPLEIKRPEPPPRPPEPPPPIPEPEPEPADEPAETLAATEPPPAPPPTDEPASSEPAPDQPTVFAGVKAARAEKIIYVVDASGAMTSSLAFVMEELSRSIARLDEGQSFQVVLFRERPTDSPSRADRGGYETFRSAGFLPAIPANKDAARAWLTTVRPVGRSTPLPGLRAALNLQPDLIFLLTRSIPRSGPTQEWGAGNGAVLASLDDLNPVSPFTGKRRVVIKAIQFIDDDPSGLLQAIAARHGDGAGAYAIRRLEELRDDQSAQTVSGQPSAIKE